MKAELLSDSLADLKHCAKQLVQEKPRHDKESLFISLDLMFPVLTHPELEQAHFESAIKEALQ